jgi:glycosyltransferase involved in cell wall biosynthesis
MDDHPLNILYLTHNSDRGESAMMIGMHRAGMDVRVFANLESRYVQAIQAAGIPVTHVSWKQKLDRATLKLIRRTVVDDRIDIIHTGNSRTTLHMVMATRPLARKGLSPKLIAYLGVTGNVTWLSPLSWFRFLNPRIDRIVCVAEGVRQYLIEVQFLGFKLDPNKVVTIHKGHKLEWYQETPADLGQFGIPSDAMVVTCASRLRSRKGLVELVQALGQTDPDRNIHVLFLGHEGNEEILSAVAELELPGRVHFAGYRLDAPAITAASDVFCLPVLRGEGLSRAVIEAMAYGVTPLVTPVGGNTELVIDGECGLVVAAGNTQALARAMEFLYERPDLRIQYGRAARQRIDSFFKSKDTIRKTRELYRNVMAETGNSDS